MKELVGGEAMNAAVPKKGLLQQYIKHKDLMLMFLPGFLLLIVFRYFPIFGITIAFKDFKMLEGILGSKWVGFENFRQLFSGGDFIQAFVNTLNISLLKLIFGFPAPIILAIVLNEVVFLKYKKVVQTLTYIPHFFSWVILSGIITMVFSADGPVNNLLLMAGASHPVEFFANGTYFICLLVATSVWQSVGWSSVLYIATIAGIDASLYEAAALDGAGKWKQIVHITVPSMIPTIITVFILNLGHVLNAGFDQIYNMYNVMVYDVSDIIDTYVLRKMSNMDYSLGMAASLFKSLISFALVVIFNFIANKISDNEMGIW